MALVCRATSGKWGLLAQAESDLALDDAMGECGLHDAARRRTMPQRGKDMLQGSR
ncbi:hypothetical protein [Sphingomonas abietis]|uniref:Uncharacterized protein n=1 Tax=Sphingomonas abietis TaxID=3012344 RepID=A0ABY7NQC4_9SPHN|nr:hypothetical protein [Sphingomonas abietis]WBO22813.1 hypothetical protein PBT88_01275 [Sphingomonas abietis]